MLLNVYMHLLVFITISNHLNAWAWVTKN